MTHSPSPRRLTRRLSAAQALAFAFAWTRRHARAACASAVQLFALIVAAVRSRWPLGTPVVEVLVTDAGRRRALERAIRQALRQLRRAIGGLPEISAVVVTGHVASAGRQLAGAAHVQQREADEGGPAGVLTVLHVGGARQLTARGRHVPGDDDGRDLGQPADSPA